MTRSMAAVLPIEVTREVAHACLCFHAQRAARTLARRFDGALRPLHLTSGQFSLLMSLNRPEPPAIGGLADWLGMDRTTLIAALKPLVRRALVRSFADADDRRVRRLELTESGIRLLVSAVPVWRRELAAVERGLADADRLRADLRALSGSPPGPALSAPS